MYALFIEVTGITDQEDASSVSLMNNFLVSGTRVSSAPGQANDVSSIFHVLPDALIPINDIGFTGLV